MTSFLILLGLIFIAYGIIGFINLPSMIMNSRRLASIEVEQLKATPTYEESESDRALRQIYIADAEEAAQSSGLGYWGIVLAIRLPAILIGIFLIHKAF